MKSNTILFIFLIVSSFNCSNQNKLNNNKREIDQHKLEFPYQFQFGMHGKGDKRPPSTIEINIDSVKISKLKNWPSGEMATYSMATNETKFVELLSAIKVEDMVGEKRFASHIRDGGYVKFTSKYGTRKFTNVLLRDVDKSFIRPDTIGLFEFEEVVKYANEMMRKFGK